MYTGNERSHQSFSIVRDLVCYQGRRLALSKAPITWRTFNPGVELNAVNRVEIFCDYMDDFNPGVEALYYTFSASIPGSKISSNDS